MANIAPVAAPSPVTLIGAFEGLRGVSALLVVLYHLKLVRSDLVAGGYLSVDVFFVLSGYIMMLNYGGRIAGARSTLDFLGKRIARLYPLFLFMTFTVMAAHGVVAPWVGKLVDHAGLAGDPQAAADALGATSAGGGNYVLRLLAWVTLTSSLGEFDRLYLNVPAWSISTEFWTYTMFAAVLVWSRNRLAMLVAMAAVLVTCALSVALYVSVARHGCLAQGRCLDVTYDAGFARCIGGFFLGVLAFKLHALISRSGRLGAIVKWLDVFLLALLILTITLSATVPWAAFGVPFVAAALVAVLPLNGPASHVLGCKPLLWLGKMSFAIYLGHLTILTALLPLFASTVSLAVKLGVFAAVLAVFAVLANRFVEEPGRRYLVRRLRGLTRGAGADGVVAESEQPA